MREGRGLGTEHQSDMRLERSLAGDDCKSFCGGWWKSGTVHSQHIMIKWVVYIGRELDNYGSCGKSPICQRPHIFLYFRGQNGAIHTGGLDHLSFNSVRSHQV